MMVFLLIVSIVGLVAFFLLKKEHSVPTPRPLPIVPPPTPHPDPRPTVKPAVNSIPSAASGKTSVSSEVALEVSKALTQIDRWANALGQRVFDEQSNQRANWSHDLEIMRARQDLKFISFELLDDQKKVIASLRMDFDQARVSPEKIVDVTRGIENLASTTIRRIIKSNRLVINGSSKRTEYAQELKISWSTADKLVEVPKVQFPSHHARKITGGRIAGTVTIAESAMETLVIKKSGARGFAFAYSVEDPVNHGNIYLSKEDAPANTRFVTGQKWRGIVVQVKGAFQVKNLERC